MSGIGRIYFRRKFRKASVLPGFGLTLGFSIVYISLIVLIPLGGLILHTAAMGWVDFWQIATDERTIGALKVSFSSAFVAALVNLIFGSIIAWVLVRYRFPGRHIVDALVDLPFALPTAVAGIALTTIYHQDGWLGSLLLSAGIQVAFTQTGIIVALIFIGLPFVVRTLQPVMSDLDNNIEEAAATLGASRWQIIWKVLRPELAPSALTGFALALARGVGEYGSVIFIAGNIPYLSEIAPLLIIIKLEEFNYPAATAIATVMLILSFTMLLIINLLLVWNRRRYGHG